MLFYMLACGNQCAKKQAQGSVGSPLIKRPHVAVFRRQLESLQANDRSTSSTCFGCEVLAASIPLKINPRDPRNPGGGFKKAAICMLIPLKPNP